MSPKDEFSVVVRGKMNDLDTNLMLDTGAGVSIIDRGTLERMGLKSQIMYKSNHLSDCFDASGNQMEIIGTIELEVELKGMNKREGWK